MRTQRLLVGLVLMSLALPGCGGCGGDDDDDGAVIIDASTPTIDAAATGDASGPACTTFQDCVDPLKLECDVDAGVCVQCLESDDCELYFFTHVCDVPARACAECLTTADCTADPSALGPTCNEAEGFCTCAGVADCATNPNGRVCDTDQSACTCVTNTDCQPPATCQDQPYLLDGKKTCQPPAGAANKNTMGRRRAR
jgi:hypothetical protein